MPSLGDSRAFVAAVALALGAVAGAAHAPATGFPFVDYEDRARLLGNPSVRPGVSGENVRWALTAEWEGSWSPVTWISHMLDFTFYGGDAGGHHLTNVLLHALNAMLLFGALRRATGDTFRPAAVALLLALHPIHVESVAWVSERKGLLAATFAFASLWGYAASARSGSPEARSFSIVCLALGLLSHPMLVSLPVLFLLLDRWPLERMRRGNVGALVAEKWPYLVLVVAFVAATWVVVQQQGAPRDLPDVSLAARLANAVVASVLYLFTLLWPHDLAVLYPHPGLPGSPPRTALEVAGAALLLAALAWGAFRARQPALRIGLLWYAIALLPVIGILRVRPEAMADRHAYLPAVGIYLGAVYGAADLVRQRPRSLRVAAIAAFACVLVALAVVSRRQIRVWHSSEALFRNATEVTRNNFTMHLELANTLRSRGRIEEALAEYRTALSIRPDVGRAHFNLANTLAAVNRVDEAIEHYRAAVEDEPTAVGARDALGRMLLHAGDLAAAIAHYRREAELRPRDAGVHATLADLLRRTGEYDEAMRAYETVARLIPGDPRWREEIAATRAEQEAQQER